MSDQLDHPPVLDRDGRTFSDLSEADAQFRHWMHKNLSHAAGHFGLTIAGQARYGWLDRSVSAPVQASDQQLWLRVVSEDKQWTDGDFWTGNLDANVFVTLPRDAPKRRTASRPRFWEPLDHELAGKPCGSSRRSASGPALRPAARRSVSSGQVTWCAWTASSWAQAAAGRTSRTSAPACGVGRGNPEAGVPC